MNRSWTITIICTAFVVAMYGANERQPVKIIDRHNSETAYSYYVPEHAQANSNGSFGCFGTGGNVNCSGSQQSSSYAVGASMTSYSVSGATLALFLRDGRVAVVNCSSKYAPKGDYINRRSCRFPLVDNIEAEFHGNKAKLFWQVSLDGKKVESETYNIVAVLGAANLANTQGSERVSVPPVNQGSGQTVASHTAPAESASSPNTSQSAAPADVMTMTWFDESAPGPTTEIRDVIITARAYDGVLNILRKLRDSDTSVKSGFSVLDSDYHPPSFRLGASIPPRQSIQVFHWDDEVPTDDSLVVHIRVTRKVFDNVSNAIGHLRVTTLPKF